MMRYRSTILALGLLSFGLASPGQAQTASAQQDQREYCPERPGLGTPPCTIAPGRVSIESGIADWTRDDNTDGRNDTVLIGDTLVRVGLTDAVEVQLGWTPFGHSRTRDKTTGMVDTANRVGDALVGLKANLSNPDGSGFSAAIQPFATIPIGRSPIGTGDWGAGVVVPLSFDLSHGLNLQLSPEIDAATDGDRHGRHLAYGSVVGLAASLSDAVEVTVELAATRDNDPEQHSTQAFGAISASWTPADDLQLDAGTALGLNHDSPDIELYAGISRRL